MTDPAANEPGSSAESPTTSRRRLSGCAWVVICVVLIVSTTAFSILWPIYRANRIITELSGKGAEIAYHTGDRPWYLKFVSKDTYIPYCDWCAVSIEGESITDNDISKLPALGHLNYLRVGECNTTYTGIRRFAEIQDVEFLVIGVPALDDDAVRHILQPHWELRELWLHGPKLTHAVWESILQFTQIRSLEFASQSMTLGSDLPDLSSLTDLFNVRLEEAQVTTAGMERLETASGLKMFTLYRCRLQSVDFAGFPSLYSLNVIECDCADSDMRGLNISRSVVHVTLNGIDLLDSDPDTFGCLPLLESLVLAGSTFTDEHLNALSNCTKLTTLNLMRCQRVSDAQIPLFAAIPNLEDLDLSETGVTAAGIEQLQAARPDLTIHSNVKLD